MYFRSWICLLFAGAVVSCNKADVDHFEGFVSPKGFHQPVYHFSTNTVPRMASRWAESFFMTHVEMDDTLSNVLERLKASPIYPELFNGAFRSKKITSDHFLKALSQFMVMCVSSNSKYDEVMRNETTFSETEQQGYTIFQARYGACDREPMFTGYSLHARRKVFFARGGS